MHFFLILVSSPKSTVIGQSIDPCQENQEGEEEPIILVTPPSSQRAFSTLPSVDSAVESWDGSNMDSSFTTPGIRPQRPTSDWTKKTTVAGRTISSGRLIFIFIYFFAAPSFQTTTYSFQDWRSTKTSNSQTSSSARQRANPLTELGLGDDDWDRPLGG